MLSCGRLISFISLMLPEIFLGWWSQFVSDEKGLMEIEHGSKMVLLMEILKECELLGDKVSISKSKFNQVFCPL